MRLLTHGDAADVYARDDGLVLKLYRAGHPRGAVEQEARNARAATAAGVPTPRVVDVVTVDGQAGIVFERADGDTMLHAIGARPAEASQLGRTLAEVHAAMHARESSDLPAQRDVLAGDIARTRDLPETLRREARAILDSLPDGHALCHGDFHPLNVVMTPAGPAVLDWYKATRGNPDADVARTLMLLRLTPVPVGLGDDARRTIDGARTAFYAGYYRGYLTGRAFDLAAVTRWMIPVAVARTARDISPHERRGLLGLANALLSEGAAATFRP